MVSEESRILIQGTLNQAYRDWQGMLSYTRQPVIDALESFSDLFEADGMSKTATDKVLRLIARILPRFKSAERIEAAANKIAGIYQDVSQKVFYNFLETQRCAGEELLNHPQSSNYLGLIPSGTLEEIAA